MEPSVKSLPLQAILPSDQMAPFTMPSSVKMVGCLTDGRLTPPSSAMDTVSAAARSTPSVRSRLTKFIPKRPRHMRSVKEGIETSSHHWDNHTNGPGCTQLLNPLPVIALPSPYPIKPIMETNNFGTPQLELRRVPPSHYDLRAIAQEQELSLEIPMGSHPHTPLLPSPVIDDRKMRIPMSQPSCFDLNKSAFTRNRRETAYKSYDDLHIISYYDDGITPVAGAMYGSNDRDSFSDDDSPRTPSSNTSPMSVQQSTTSSKSSPNTSESGWLAGTTSHDERMRRYKARCYQVVQHPYRSKRPTYETEDEIMLATVLVGPGKPKLVQIQRHPSSNNSIISKESLVTTQTNNTIRPTTKTPPCTPMHHQPEISAFSPYDTPSNFTPFTDLSYSRPSSNRPKTYEPTYSASKIDLIPMPLKTLRHVASESTITTHGEYEAILQNAYNSHQHPSVTNNTSQQLKTNNKPHVKWLSNENNQPPPFQPLPTIRVVTQARNHNLDRIINAITRVVDMFPHERLFLETPIVTDLRPEANYQTNQQMINIFGAIFPTTPRALLSELAAWLVVDSYFLGLDSTKINTNPVPPQTPTKPFQLIPSKARDLLGMDTNNDGNDKILIARIKALRINIGFVAQSLIETVRGRAGPDIVLWRALNTVVKLADASHQQQHGYLTPPVMATRPNNNRPPHTAHNQNQQDHSIHRPLDQKRNQRTGERFNFYEEQTWL